MSGRACVANGPALSQHYSTEVANKNFHVFLTFKKGRVVSSRPVINILLWDSVECTACQITS